MKYFIITLLFFFEFSAFCKTPKSEDEFKKITAEITEVTKQLQAAWVTKNEEALYSFNIEKKTSPLAEKISSFLDRNPDYKDSFHDKVSILNGLLDKINNQNAKERSKIVEDADKALKKSEKSLGKPVDKKDSSNTLSQNISYDDWFTLQNTGVKSGTKYSFNACVNGSRNVTAARCHVSGSEAKRVFYSTDDIKDIETKKKWVNTINQVACVTAYVTAHEAFIVDIKDSNQCK